MTETLFPVYNSVIDGPLLTLLAAFLDLGRGVVDSAKLITRMSTRINANIDRC